MEYFLLGSLFILIGAVLLLKPTRSFALKIRMLCEDDTSFTPSRALLLNIRLGGLLILVKGIAIMSVSFTG